MAIQIEHWEYTCGDGCCYDYGVYLFVDGVQVEEPFYFATKADALEYFITSVLGLTVEEIYEDED